MSDPITLTLLDGALTVKKYKNGSMRFLVSLNTGIVETSLDFDCELDSCEENAIYLSTSAFEYKDGFLTITSGDNEYPSHRSEMKFKCSEEDKAKIFTFVKEEFNEEDDDEDVLYEECDLLELAFHLGSRSDDMCKETCNEWIEKCRNDGIDALKELLRNDSNHYHGRPCDRCDLLIGGIGVERDEED